MQNIWDPFLCRFIPTKSPKSVMPTSIQFGNNLETDQTFIANNFCDFIFHSFANSNREKIPQIHKFKAIWF